MVQPQVAQQRQITLDTVKVLIPPVHDYLTRAGNEAGLQALAKAGQNLAAGSFEALDAAVRAFGQLWRQVPLSEPDAWRQAVELYIEARKYEAQEYPRVPIPQ